MGWWKIDDESGGIGNCLPSGHPGKGALCNAVPGRDDPEDQYNGDGPADVMGKAIREVDKLYEDTWGRHARPDEMQACFNFVRNGWIREVHTPPTSAS